MQKNIVIILCLTLLINACKGKKEATALDNKTTSEPSEKIIDDNSMEIYTFNPTVPEEYRIETVLKGDMILHFRKTPCFGNCPVYYTYINSDGTGFYEGIRNVNEVGQFSFQLDENQLSIVKEKMEKLNYLSLEDFYDSPITDVPSTIITFNLNRKKKQILSRYESPEKLMTFIKEMEEIIFSTKKTPSK
jgi:hypothetical protein